LEEGQTENDDLEDARGDALIAMSKWSENIIWK
jgi:hypothetical protein